MIIEIDTSKCFECGELATEHHHIIPQVNGGTKTIPLCSSCHMKVHGIKSKRRTDSHIENTKRGLDRSRIWELLSGWLIQKKHNCNDNIEFLKYYKSYFDGVFPIQKVNRIFNRISELEDFFLLSLFKNEINNNIILYFIDADDFSILDDRLIKIISNNLKSNKGKLGNPENLSNKSRTLASKKVKKNALNNKINIKNTRFIIELKKKGGTFYEISKQMNEKGLKTRTGKAMNEVQVKRLYERYLKKTTN